MRIHHVLLLLGALSLGTAFLFDIAEATHITGHDAAQGCARMTHDGSSGDRFYKVSLETTPVAADACADQAGYSLPTGSCWTLNAAVSTTGAPPAAPDTVEVYILADLMNEDHGTAGTAAWATRFSLYSFTGASFNGQTITHCPTHDGTSGGNARIGTFRIAIRACEYVSGSACPGSTTSYDINTDPGSNGGSPGIGNSVTGRTQGGLRSGTAPTSFTDALTLGGADVSTYVPGDERTLRLAGIQAGTTHYETKIRLSILSEASATLDTFDANISNTANADATFSTSLRESDAYPNATNPTKRAEIVATSTLLDEPWTYWTGAPAGSTLTTSTRIDAAWGLVDKGLRITCPTITNPTGSGDARKLNRGVEAINCASGVVTNARGALTNGAFISTFARRSAQSIADTTDVPRCDSTVGASGAWTCAPTIKSTATTTDTTSSLDYALDVRQYAESGRTTLLGTGTMLGLMDASSNVTFSPASGAFDCGGQVTTTATTYRKGATATLTWRLCGARLEQATWTGGTATTARSAGGAIEHGPTVVNPSSGIYTRSYTIGTSEGANQDAAGMAHKLTYSNAGNTVTQDPIYGVSNLLAIDAFNTWSNECTGQESALYVIGDEKICATQGPVRDLDTSIVTRALTFSRTYTASGGGDTLTPDSESGVTTGTSTSHKLTPAPPKGVWTFQVNASDASGNYGTHNKTITFLSPLTSPYMVDIIGANIPAAPCDTIPIQLRTLRHDATTGAFEPYATDAAPTYWVNHTDAAHNWQTTLAPTTSTPTTQSPQTYWANVTIPCDWTPGAKARFHAYASFDGVPVAGWADILILTPTGGDPLTAWAPDVTTGQTARITILSKYDNGTSRLGLAANISVYVLAPDGSLLINGANPTELLTPRIGYYTTDLTTTTQEGRYTILVTARTSQNEIRSSPPTGFRALPLPVTRADIDSARSDANATATEQRAHADYQHASANSTAAPLATSTHIENTNQYLASLTNATPNNIWTSGTRTLTDKTGYELSDGERALANTSIREPLGVQLNATLSAATFTDWRDNEARAAWDTVNGTDANVTTANNTASGAVTQAHFNAWRDGEARPQRSEHNATRANTNVTVDEQRGLRLALENVATALGGRIDNSTSVILESQPVHLMKAGWSEVKPPTRDHAILLFFALVMLTAATLGRQHIKHRGSWFGGSIISLAAYAYSLLMFQ